MSQAGSAVRNYPPQDDAPSVPRRRWGIAWLLGIGVLVNYLDRVNLSVSHTGLVAAFGISNITFGYLSAAYNWTYALCQLPVGVLLDRYGVRKVGRISAFMWSIASMLAAIAPNIASLFGARLLLGVGEAPTFPANAKATGYWFPEEERGLATSIFDSAAKFSSAIGVPVLGIILIRLGWRWSFAITGIISLLYFFAFYVFYRDPGDDAKLSGIEKRHIAGPVSSEWTPLVTEPDERVSLTYLLRRRKVLGLALGFGSYNYVFYLLLTWLPSYLSSELHIDLLHSFLYTGVPWLFATFADFLGGWSADRLIKNGHDASRVRLTYLTLGLAFGLGIIGAAYSRTATQALIWISISLCGLSAAAPVGWSVPTLIAPRGSVGSVGGILNFSNQLSGIFAPILTGFIVAKTHSYALSFWVAAIYLCIGICGYIFLLGSIEPIPHPAEARASSL
jgi:MFS transporter, ACS family, D-galactonate transporter